MRLTKIAILALKGAGSQAKERVREAAGGVTMATVNRWISENDDMLTKAAILKVIREETGLTDSEILEEDTVKEDQN